MIRLIKCPSCGSSKFNKHISCIDHSMSKEVFTIVSCETCQFKFTNPRPSESDLGNYYKSENYISHTNNKSGIINKLYQIARRYSIKTKIHLLKKIKENKKILDIGSGTGEFLNACKKIGFETKGIEPSQKAKQQAEKNFNLDITDKTSLVGFKSDEFDNITMWHVLEHISDLNQTLKELNRILKPEGQLIIAVPNHNSFDAVVYKEYWAAWDLPIHLWHFSKESLETIANKHKLKLVKQKAMIFDSFYVSLLSEKYKNGKNNFIKSIIVGLFSNINGILTKDGHSSTIYIFETIK